MESDPVEIGNNEIQNIQPYKVILIVSMSVNTHFADQD